MPTWAWCAYSKTRPCSYEFESNRLLQHLAIGRNWILNIGYWMLVVLQHNPGLS